MVVSASVVVSVVDAESGGVKMEMEVIDAVSERVD